MTDNVDRMRRQFDAFDRKDVDGLVASYHEDAVVIDHAQRRTATDRQGIRTFYDDQFALSSDQERMDTSIVASGEWTIMRSVLRGTHDGSFAGLEPTGRPFEVPFCNLVRWQDGKAIEDHTYYDLYTLLEQLGQVPALTASA